MHSALYIISVIGLFFLSIPGYTPIEFSLERGQTNHGFLFSEDSQVFYNDVQLIKSQRITKDVTSIDISITPDKKIAALIFNDVDRIHHHAVVNLKTFEEHFVGGMSAVDVYWSPNYRSVAFHCDYEGQGVDIVSVDPLRPSLYQSLSNDSLLYSAQEVWWISDTELHARLTANPNYYNTSLSATFKVPGNGLFEMTINLETKEYNFEVVNSENR